MTAFKFQPNFVCIVERTFKLDTIHYFNAQRLIVRGNVVRNDELILLLFRLPFVLISNLKVFKEPGVVTLVTELVIFLENAKDL